MIPHIIRETEANVYNLCLWHVNQEDLDRTVRKLATVSTNPVILSRVYVLMVDVHVGIQAVTVVQVCTTHDLF